VNCCAPRIAAGDLNFYGNVEGNDIFKGTVDIVVCDGFVGNVALKATEGLASMIGGFPARGVFPQHLHQAGRLVAYPVLAAFKRRVDHRRYNGAALLGLRGLVFKSHGSADALAFEHALARAYDAARNNCSTASGPHCPRRPFAGPARGLHRDGATQENP
jgi:glycerol-3-phosphate acyltransferase PlsX